MLINIKKFLDKKKEFHIGILVLAKYFYYSKQLELDKEKDILELCKNIISLFVESRMLPGRCIVLELDLIHKKTSYYVRIKERTSQEERRVN